MKSRIRRRGVGKEGGWETTCCRTPTQSWVMNEKDPPKDALKKWSKYPKAAKMEFDKSQAKKNRDMVNCFHSWSAGWENESLRFKAQLTMIKVIFRSPYLAWRDSLRSNPVQSANSVTCASALPFSMPLACCPSLQCTLHGACLCLSSTGPQ